MQQESVHGLLLCYNQIMKVKFFAYLRDNDYAGCKETEQPACATLRELGEELSQKYGEKFRSFYFSPDGKDFSDLAIVLVNGRKVDFLNGLDTELSDSDTVLIFPVVAGG